MSTKGNWQKTSLEICSSNLGCLIGPFGWRQVVGSLFSLKMSLKKTSQPQCCWQNWGWTLCSPLDEFLSLCKQECGIKMFGKRVNGKLCVCVNLMRAFPSANASYGCIQCLFNANSVFAIVWIHIFPFLLPKCFWKYFVLFFFYNEQELGLIPLGLLLKLTTLLTLKIDQIILNLDFWQNAACSVLKKSFGASIFFL